MGCTARVGTLRWACVSTVFEAYKEDLDGASEEAQVVLR